MPMRASSRKFSSLSRPWIHAWVVQKPPHRSAPRCSGTAERTVRVPEARLAWKSSRPSVAMVDRNGLITAKGSGNSVISVLSENGEKAVVQCKVAVTAGIVIKPKQLELRVGEKFELDTDVVDEKGAPAENQTVNWASSNHSVAIVNDYGEVTALSPGEITITATQIEVYAKVKVIVKPAEQSE